MVQPGHDDLVAGRPVASRAPAPRRTSAGSSTGRRPRRPGRRRAGRRRRPGRRATASSARRSASVTVPRLAMPAVSVRATASATQRGTCEPPGPSKWATPRSRAGKAARTRPTSRACHRGHAGPSTLTVGSPAPHRTTTRCDGVVRGVRLAVHGAGRHVHEVAGHRVERCPAAGAELHPEPAAHDVDGGLVRAVVVPAGHRAGLGGGGAGPHRAGADGPAAQHARRRVGLLQPVGRDVGQRVLGAGHGVSARTAAGLRSAEEDRTQVRRLRRRRRAARSRPGGRPRSPA